MGEDSLLERITVRISSESFASVEFAIRSHRAG